LKGKKNQKTKKNKTKEKIKKDKEKKSFTLASFHFAITKVTQHEIHFMSNLGAKTFHAMLGCFVFFSCQFHYYDS
jgi:hypothetical protein